MSEERCEASEVEKLRSEISQLQLALAERDRIIDELRRREQRYTSGRVNDLSNDDIERYSRQLILPDFGVGGQLKLKRSRIIIVGMGGLGCPAAQYLVAAGCGKVGFVDYDNVERSNFHRQTLHTESRIGWSKVESARQALLEVNPDCRIEAHYMSINSETALELLQRYDVVLDCTDNVATRYLLNDACVMLNKPLVSGSALQLDGQLTVYNYGDAGPCYRCLFPVPPPPETVTNCGDGGVLGAVTGVIGAMQALEAIKIVVNMGTPLAGRLLIFDGSRCSIRTIKLRARRIDCDVCSAEPMIVRLIDYEEFCGMRASDKNYSLNLLSDSERLRAQEYREMQGQNHLLIDVRQPAEFEICRLPGSVNVPLRNLLDDSFSEQFKKELADKELPIVVLCRRGNDSQIAVQHLRNKYPQHSIRDIRGGLHAWHYKVDNNFPIY